MTLINTIEANETVSDTGTCTKLPLKDTLTYILDATLLASHGQKVLLYMEGLVQSISDNTLYYLNNKVAYKVIKNESNIVILDLYINDNVLIPEYDVSRDNCFTELLSKTTLRVCTVKEHMAIVKDSDRVAEVKDAYLFRDKFITVSELTDTGSIIGNGVNVLYNSKEDIKNVLLYNYRNTLGENVQVILEKLIQQMIKIENNIL